MQATIVRHAQAGDIDWLAAHDRWPRAEDWPPKIAARHLVVAEYEGERAGWARLDVLWSTVPFLALIQVLPPWRGCGLSRALLAFIESDLHRRGYAALLSSAQSDEPAAQAWHQHMGFARNGIVEHVAGDGIHELVYRKPLEAAPRRPVDPSKPQPNGAEARAGHARGLPSYSYGATVTVALTVTLLALPTVA